MRVFIVTVFAFVLSFMPQARAQKPVDSCSSPLRDSVIAYAKSYLGTKYVWRGSSPKGFDCSGFVSYVFAHFNMSLPHGSKSYATVGKKISLEECCKGDVMVFRGTHAHDKSPGHVGIVISEKGEPVRFIHSSSSKAHWGVVITEYAKSAYPKRFLKVVRVL